MDDFGNELDVSFTGQLRACYFVLDSLLPQFVEFVLTHLQTRG